MISSPIVVDVNSPDLDDSERQLAANLSVRLMRTRSYLQVRENYYDGVQRIQHLNIAIPQQLQLLHAALGWPRLAVDVLDERLDVQGFRFPSSLDADQELWDIWTGNEMDQESQLAHLDSFVFGRGFAMVGTGDTDLPLITVESPMNMVANFDARTRQVVAGLQSYEMDGQEAAAIYLPDSTIHLIRPTDTYLWEIYDRDDHELGRCPVEMLTNRARTHDRYGRSEITAEVMSITDAACRTLLGMEIAREFFGAPQRYILGAAESAFQKADGTPTDAWKTYTGHILALERDDDGDVPTVGTFSAGDPTVYTNILMMYSKIMASITGLPPHMLGFAADNPASAEGIRSAESRLDKRAERKQRGLEGSWRKVMQLAMMIANGGKAPADAAKIDVLWADVATPTLAATTAALYQQVQMGYIPGTSEVLGQKLGYSAVERARIALDRSKDEAASFEAELAHSLIAKEARVDTSLEADISGHPAGVTPAVPGAPPVPVPAPAPAHG